SRGPRYWEGLLARCGPAGRGRGGSSSGRTARSARRPTWNGLPEDRVALILPPGRGSGQCSPAAAAPGGARSLRLHIVAEQDIVIAQVELAIGDDGVRPGGELRVVVGLVEAAPFLVAVRRGVHQGHRPLLTPDVEPAVRRGERALAHRGVVPFDLAGLGVGAHQLLFVRAVLIIPDADESADVAGQGLVEEYLLGREALSLGYELDHGPRAALAAAGGAEHVAVPHDGRRDVGQAVGRLRVAPEQLAVAGRDADQLARDEVHVLFDAAGLGDDDRRIGGRGSVRDRRLPDDLPALLVTR